MAMFKFILGRVVKNIASLTMLGALFFSFSGTIEVMGFWIYVGTVLVYQIISLLIVVPKHPEYIELANLRKIKHWNTKKWDPIVVGIVSGAVFLMYILAAVDVGRLHIGKIPFVLTLAGIVLYTAGSALNQWAMLHNTHFEREVRIQTDRDHQVITTGPYRYMRHPGYSGSVLGLISFPLLIGSAIALLGSVVCIAGMVVRTYLEDRALSQELAGYAEYTRTVQYRLMPFVW